MEIPNGYDNDEKEVGIILLHRVERKNWPTRRITDIFKCQNEQALTSAIRDDSAAALSFSFSLGLLSICA